MQRTNLFALIALPLLCLVLAVALALGNTEPATSDAPASKNAATATARPAANVQLSIDYGDNVEKHFTAIPHGEGMTVFEALGKAEAHTHGIKIVSSGSGTTAFVRQIDDLVNASGKGGKYWQFSVNGVYAEQGCGSIVLKAGDRVRWFYDEYKPTAATSPRKSTSP